MSRLTTMILICLIAVVILCAPLAPREPHSIIGLGLTEPAMADDRWDDDDDDDYDDDDDDHDDDDYDDDHDDD